MCALDDLAIAMSSCMITPKWISVEVLEQTAQTFAASGLIDPIENMGRTRAYFYSGTKDTTVVTGVRMSLLD